MQTRSLGGPQFLQVLLHFPVHMRFVRISATRHAGTVDSDANPTARLHVANLTKAMTPSRLAQLFHAFRPLRTSVHCDSSDFYGVVTLPNEAVAMEAQSE